MSSMDDGECRVNLVSLDHPWLPVYTGLPPCRVSVDAIVTVVSLDHPWLPVYTGLPPCQSIRGLHSYSGIPGPSMVFFFFFFFLFQKFITSIAHGLMQRVKYMHNNLVI